MKASGLLAPAFRALSLGAYDVVVLLTYRPWRLRGLASRAGTRRVAVSLHAPSASARVVSPPARITSHSRSDLASRAAPVSSWQRRRSVGAP